MERQHICGDVRVFSVITHKSVLCRTVVLFAVSWQISLISFISVDSIINAFRWIRLHIKPSLSAGIIVAVCARVLVLNDDLQLNPALYP